MLIKTTWFDALVMNKLTMAFLTCIEAKQVHVMQFGFAYVFALSDLFVKRLTYDAS